MTPPPPLHPMIDALLRQSGAAAETVPTAEAWGVLLGRLNQMCEATQRSDAESAAILRATLESAIEGVFVVDNDGRVIAVNQRFVELARLPSSELATRDAQSVVAAGLRMVRDPEAALARIDGLRGTDLTMREELELVDGARIDWFTAPVRTPDGARVGRVAFFRDVTAERRAHRDLDQAREAAEAASQAKSVFLANMSHELRTPLNAVIGIADLMRLERDPLVDRQREYLAGIATNGRHLLALVNDVLDLAKIEAGKQELRLQSIRVHEAIEEGMAAILPLAKARGVMLEPATIVAVPSVRADQVRLRQILYNLISNAVKFTNRNGVVRIRARRDGDRVAISVIDTGIGIAPADLPRLYGQFEQLTSSSGDRPAGTGLGLALTKRLVEMHGGTIDVDSKLGVGSTFTVRIPVA